KTRSGLATPRPAVTVHGISGALVRQHHSDCPPGAARKGRWRLYLGTRRWQDADDLSLELLDEAVQRRAAGVASRPVPARRHAVRRGGSASHPVVDEEERMIHMPGSGTMPALRAMTVSLWSFWRRGRTVERTGYSVGA